MRLFTRLLIICTIFSFLIGCSVAPTKTPEEYMLVDFEQSFNEHQLDAHHVTYRHIEKDNNALLIVDSPEELTGQAITIKETADKPWKLDGYYLVKADVQNLSNHKIQVEMFVGNDPDGLVRWYCSDYIDLAPQQSGTITVALAWSPWVFDKQPEIVGMRGAPGMVKTDLTAINSVLFRSRYGTEASSFSVDNIRATQKLEVKTAQNFFPFIDEFGQYKHKQWEGKTNQLEDLLTANKEELKELEEQKEPKHINKYGGWENGPKLKATGFFRVEKSNDYWWMVDPEGKLFWSNGLNCVNSNMTLTGIQEREHYFESLPSENEQLSAFYGTGGWATHGFYKDKIPFKAYNFLQANLHRIYGEKWEGEFRDLTHKRLRSWGMNTFGNVSDRVATQQGKTPYVGTVWIHNTPKIQGSNGFWGKFHDVFDPKFREAVRVAMETQKNGANDPWCIGFFVDNEMSWGLKGSLALATLRSPATQPAKQAFIADLKQKYQTVEALNERWGMNYTSWNHLLQSTDTPSPVSAKADLNAFYSKIAQTYFHIVKDELHKVAPNQMYLGCRFAWANNELTLKAAADYCDIISFNKYEYSVADLSLPLGIDKPVMIGEYHFGATDRGHFNYGVKKAEDQKHRGLLYRNYIEGALANRLIVGAHWFQYTDQAMTGREDGENYNVGFVDICNRPYKELIQYVRETNYNMYDYRSEQADKLSYQKK